tara:strand:- start:24531 stop:25079 length:549 start_codon:yes stop_codon:yes gene_type:complete
MIEKEISKTLDVIKKGGVILYPTDTIWGIGCDSSNINAIEKVYKIKNREESKSFITLVSDLEMLKKYTGWIPEFNIVTEPTTIIFPKVKMMNKKLLSTDGSSAIRVTSDDFCKNLIKKLNRGLVSTSANISGNCNPKCFNEIEDNIKEHVDYIVNLRIDEQMEKPSRIIKILPNGNIKNIRK